MLLGGFRQARHLAAGGAAAAGLLRDAPPVREHAAVERALFGGLWRSRCACGLSRTVLTGKSRCSLRLTFRDVVLTAKTFDGRTSNFVMLMARSRVPARLVLGLTLAIILDTAVQL